MESNRRKRRRTDDAEGRPSVSRKLSSISTPKDIRLDDQYRRQLYGVSVRDALRKKLEARARTLHATTLVNPVLVP